MLLPVSPWPPQSASPRPRPLTCFSTLHRSPPRPSPGSLHYSDEDVTKYNDLIPAESSSLTEKPSEISDSQVRCEQERRAGGGAGPALRKAVETMVPELIMGLLE